MKSLSLVISALLFPLLAMAAPPNIILMMGDDHGWEETGYNGHPHVKTPVLDEMAATGLKFERFYAAHSSCSPTRASFLTGRHPNRMGTFTPGWSLRPEEITIAHLLAKAGYHCMHLGKWHVGAVKAGSPVNPGAMGFHEWLSHDNFFEMDPSFSRNGGPPEVFKGESSEILIREAIAGIERARAANKPVFQVIWFGSPHEPYSGLPQDLALYDDLPAKYPKMVGLTSNETGGSTRRPQGEVLRERYAEITAMDRAIGMLRKHLAETGLRDNTLLFYCGDNGTSPESALGFPHRGVKGEIYEGGTLVPGVMEWPARIPKPRVHRFPRVHQRPAAHPRRHHRPTAAGPPARRHRSHPRDRWQAGRPSFAHRLLGIRHPAADVLQTETLHRSRIAGRHHPAGQTQRRQGHA